MPSFSLRPFLMARSFSEPRAISIITETPEAYVEWGAPSQFEIDAFADDHSGGGDPPAKRRKHIDYRAVGIGTLAHSKVIVNRDETFVGGGSLFEVHEFLENIIMQKLAFNSSLGRGVVFHVKTGMASEPKIPTSFDFPEEAETEGFYPYELTSYSEIS